MSNLNAGAQRRDCNQAAIDAFFTTLRASAVPLLELSALEAGYQALRLAVGIVATRSETAPGRRVGCEAADVDGQCWQRRSFRRR
jgi:hypothetical protein